MMTLHRTDSSHSLRYVVNLNTIPSTSQKSLLGEFSGCPRGPDSRLPFLNWGPRLYVSEFSHLVLTTGVSKGGPVSGAVGTAGFRERVATIPFGAEDVHGTSVRVFSRGNPFLLVLCVCVNVTWRPRLLICWNFYCQTDETNTSP